MITLYDHPLSPYAQKVRIALREKQIPFQLALQHPVTQQILVAHAIGWDSV